MKEISLKSLVAPHFWSGFNKTTPHQIFTGGRGSTKTSRNALKVVCHMLDDPECNAVVVSRHYNIHRHASYLELLVACNRLGLIEDVHYKTSISPLQIKFGKNRVQFVGLDDYNKIKGRTVSHGRTKIVWFFELNLLHDSYDISNIIATFSRGNTDYFFNLYEWNPPPNETHWTYDWLEKQRRRKDVIAQHSTYLDLPLALQKRWLGSFFVNEAKNLELYDEEQHRNVYLGLSARLSGAIYKRWSREFVCSQLNPAHYQRIVIGMDCGETDATTFVAIGVMSDRIEVVAQWYHKNLEHSAREQLDINDYTDAAKQFLLSMENQFHKPMQVFIDSASKSFYTLVKGKCSQLAQIRRTDKAMIVDRINFMNLLLGSRSVLIHENCRKLIVALENATYNAKGERRDDGFSDIDSLDALEYGLQPILRTMTSVILARQPTNVERVHFTGGASRFH